MFYNIFHFQRTPHPSLIQRLQLLEQKNRQLQFCLKQQQQYTESIMQRKNPALSTTHVPLLLSQFERENKGVAFYPRCFLRTFTFMSNSLSIHVVFLKCVADGIFHCGKLPFWKKTISMKTQWTYWKSVFQYPIEYDATFAGTTKNVPPYNVEWFIGLMISCIKYKLNNHPQ